jgi:threonine dehydratase
VILPQNPIPEKVHAILETGAKVVKIKSGSEREKKVRQIVKQTGAVYVHPFNDPAIIAGAGTCGLEITQQLSEFDSVIVPVGGGGLISGIAIAIRALKPSAKVFGVEPIAAPKLQAAMKAGKVVNLDSPKSIADGLIPPSVGDLTLKACIENVEGVFSASDDHIVSALKLLIREAHIFPEPSAAASLAPLLSGTNTRELGKKLVLVISGGNISLNFLRSLLRSKNK